MGRFDELWCVVGFDGDDGEVGVGRELFECVCGSEGIGVVGVTGEGKAMFVDGSGMGCAAEEGYLVFGGEKGAEEGADGACAKDDYV